LQQRKTVDGERCWRARRKLNVQKVCVTKGSTRQRRGPVKWGEVASRHATMRGAGRERESQVQPILGTGSDNKEEVSVKP